MKPLISIIVPVYNCENYIDKCIRSILDQTYRNLEIILVDDGSIDGSFQICDYWSHKDHRVVFISKRNGGAASARNLGLKYAKGDIIGFVDGDDYIAHNMYELMIQNMIDTKADVVCCGRFYIKYNRFIIRLCNPEQFRFSPEEAISDMLVLKSMDEAVWDKIYKKELFVDIQFPEGEINEDLMVIPYIFAKCSLVTHIGIPLYYYRYTSGGVTKSNYSERNSAIIKHMCQIEKYIDSSFPQLQFPKSCFLARYSLTSLADLLDTADWKCKFQSDYDYYINTLKKNYSALFRCKTYDWKFKVKGILLLLGFYTPIKRMKDGISFFGRKFKSF